MFRTILFPTDGSSQTEKAITVALDFARQVGGKIITLSVSEPYPFSPLSESAYAGGSEAYERHSLEMAQTHVDEVASAARAAGIPCETMVVSSFDPHDEITRIAEQKECDVIIMATHGRRGLSKLFAGSETQKVIAKTHIPVMVIR